MDTVFFSSSLRPARPWCPIYSRGASQGDRRACAGRFQTLRRNARRVRRRAGWKGMVHGNLKFIAPARADRIRMGHDDECDRSRCRSISSPAIAKHLGVRLSASAADGRHQRATFGMDAVAVLFSGLLLQLEGQGRRRLPAPIRITAPFGNVEASTRSAELDAFALLAVNITFTIDRVRRATPSRTACACSVKHVRAERADLLPDRRSRRWQLDDDLRHRPAPVHRHHLARSSTS